MGCQWERAYTIVKENLEELAENGVVTATSAAPAAAGCVSNNENPRVSSNHILEMNGLYLVPYRTSTKFHGRSSEIKWIKIFFSTRPNSQTLQQRLVLQGFAGIGKTGIAVPDGQGRRSLLGHGEIQG